MGVVRGKQPSQFVESKSCMLLKDFNTSDRSRQNFVKVWPATESQQAPLQLITAQQIRTNDEKRTEARRAQTTYKDAVKAQRTDRYFDNRQANVAADSPYMRCLSPSSVCASIGNF
eukprot:2626024-Amphidinium_carterae.1